MKPLIPYMRKSSREDPAASRDRQRRSIRAWAKQHNVPLADEVWEPGVKGSRSWKERGLGQALAACERGEAGGIIVEEQSRLSRENMRATAEVWETLERAGARLVCTAEGLDTGNGGDQELNYTIKAALAREQWKQYRRRAEAAKLRAVEDGVHIGPAPFGYTRPGPHAPLRKDAAKANAVKAAFDLRARGCSYGDVIHLLDRKAPGGPSGRGAWNRNTITRLLSNRVYLGEARGGAGHVKEGAHKAIVTRETFDTVQALQGREERAAEPVSVKSLLAGVARCASCGYALDRNRVAGRYFVYRCRGRSATGICPAPTSAMVDALDELVLGEVREQLRRERVEQVPVTVDVDAIHERLAANERKREPYVDPEFVALLGKENAKRALATLDAEKAKLQHELAGAVPALTGELTVHEALELLDSSSVADQRAVIADMLQAVTVSRGVRRGVPLADRVVFYWHGEDLPFVVPSRGRAAEVVVGEAAA